MSIKCMNWVWDNTQFSGNKQVLMLALADHAQDDSGIAFPGVSRLTERARYSNSRSVQEAIRLLEEGGEVLVDYNAGIKTISGWTNRYYLLGYRRDVLGLDDTSLIEKILEKRRKKELRDQARKAARKAKEMSAGSPLDEASVESPHNEGVSVGSSHGVSVGSSHGVSVDSPNPLANPSANPSALNTSSPGGEGGRERDELFDYVAEVFFGKKPGKIGNAGGRIGMHVAFLRASKTHFGKEKIYIEPLSKPAELKHVQWFVSDWVNGKAPADGTFKSFISRGTSLPLNVEKFAIHWSNWANYRNGKKAGEIHKDDAVYKKPEGGVDGSNNKFARGSE